VLNLVDNLVNNLVLHYQPVQAANYYQIRPMFALLLQSSAVEQVLDIALLYLHIVLSVAACLSVT